MSWFKEVVVEPWAEAMDQIDNEPRFFAAALLGLVFVVVCIAVFATVTTFAFWINAIVGWFWLGWFSYWVIKSLWRNIQKPLDI